MSSNYQKVLEFNKAFGVETKNIPQLNIFEENPKLIEYRMSLITEEYQETVDAVKNKDLIETIDGLTDMLFVIYGAYTALGINADKAFEIVNESNSVDIYLNEVPQRYDSPSYRLSDDKKYYVVYNKNTMKILKSHKYTPANFNEIIHL
jgi:predicted HAD superfamily Cof-like phosphohydrolase